MHTYFAYHSTSLLTKITRSNNNQDAAVKIAIPDHPVWTFGVYRSFSTSTYQYFEDETTGRNHFLIASEITAGVKTVDVL